MEKNPLKDLRIMLKLNPYVKTLWWNTILCQARNHKLRMEKAVGALAVRSGQKEATGKKQPVVVKKGKKPRPISIKKQKQPVVGKKAAAARKPATDKKPADKKTAPKKSLLCKVSDLFVPERSNPFGPLILNKGPIRDNEEKAKIDLFM